MLGHKICFVECDMCFYSNVSNASHASRVLKKNQKKLSKGSANDGARQAVVDASIADVQKHYKFLIDTERNAVRRVLTEERSRYSTFAGKSL